MACCDCLQTSCYSVSPESLIFMYNSKSMEVGTYTTAKVCPDLQDDAHVVRGRGPNGILEYDGLGTCGIVHAHDTRAEVLLHLGKVLVHFVEAVGAAVAVVVLQGVAKALEAICH